MKSIYIISSTNQTAFQESGFACYWHDARKELSSINEAAISGILINVTRKNPFLLNMGFKHWYPIRPLDGKWWNLDSKLAAPEPINNFREYLRKILMEPQTQLILLTTPDVTKEQLYWNSDSVPKLRI
jgi:josephin